MPPRILALGTALILGIHGVAAETRFYVDSAWTGWQQTGDPSAPWRSLAMAAWASINAALATNNVVVLFSAKASETDADGVYDSNKDGTQDGIELTLRTAKSPFYLTLDGSSYYNTNVRTPSWRRNSGTNMCKVSFFNSQNREHLKYSNITIHGFRVVCNAVGKEITICGDNWTIESCDSSHTSALGGVSSGPGILLVPTADGAHGGSAFYAPPWTNILIRSNTVHETYGEALYIGGGGMNPGEAGSGYPAHSQITVEYNTIFSAGTWGGQGDGIDVKGGIRQCAIRRNNIHSLNTASGNRAIVASGQPIGSTGIHLTIDGNFIHDCSGISEGIASSDTWGVPQGIIICNNIISGITNASGSGNGITVATTQDQILIANNTIYNCRGRAIEMTTTNGGAKLRNNLVFVNNGGRSQVILKGSSVNSDYNAFLPPWGVLSEGPHSVSLTEVEIAKALANPSGGDFRLTAESALQGKGEVLGQFATDISGRNRAASWDIGAYNYSHIPLSNGPANLQRIR